jgi:hypothetical protein
MAVIYLAHPIHGTKVACSNMEADFDEQNGWERYNVDTPVLAAKVVEVAVEEPVAIELVANALKPKTRRKSA